MTLKFVFKSGIRVALAACALIGSVHASDAQTRLKQEMTRDIEGIAAIVDANYAPKAWKLEHCGWDLNREVQIVKSKIQAADHVTVKDYQQYIKQFFAAMQDWHVSVHFHRTEKASLPIGVRSAEGRYFLAYIDQNKLSAYSFPFSVGDEIVAFGGRPVAEVIEELRQEEIGPDATPTAYALAELTLTHRNAARGHKVPKGYVTISVKPQGTDKVCDHQLIWDYKPEKISDWAHDPKAPPAQHSPFDLRMVGMFSPDLQATAKEDSPFLIGARTSFLPKLGDVTWQSVPFATYDSYIFTHKEKKIGVLRIPHFSMGEWEVDEFAELIEKFEEETDLLVIDQLNNPGGSVFYMYSLLSMLTDKPIHTPAQRMTVTTEQVEMAIELLPELEKISSEHEAVQMLGDNLGGYPVSYPLVLGFIDYFRFIVDEWGRGRGITDPYQLYGVDQINPSLEVHYTKPILILVNELDFSCGDFFPATLQDAGRAVVMGTRTAGAGGYVLAHGYPNRLGISHFSYTGSIAKRDEGQPIENLGVTPDLLHDVTVKDREDHFVDFADAILRQIDTMF